MVLLHALFDDCSVAAIEQNGFSACVYNEIRKWSIHMKILIFFLGPVLATQKYLPEKPVQN